LVDNMKLISAILMACLCVACARNPAPSGVIDIHVGDSGHFSLQPTATGPQGLSRDLTEHQREYNLKLEAPRVLIEPSEDATHRSLLLAMDICISAGFWDIKIADSQGNMLPIPHFWKFEPSDDHLWVPTNAVRLDILATGYDSSVMESVSTNVPLLVTCQEQSLHRDLVSILQRCSLAGNTNVYVVSIMNEGSAKAFGQW
jgi:hypothetical protein